MARPTRKIQPSRTRQTNQDMDFQDVGSIKRKRSWVIYGKSGTGKTTLAGSFPGPALLLDCRDEGTDSVSDVEGLMVKDIQSFDDFEEVYWYLKEHPKEFKTVIVDTVTMLMFMIIEELVGDKLKKSGKAPGDWGTMTKQDWGTVASKLKVWITNYRDLPMEIVFLAQERTFNVGDEESDVGGLDPEVGPSLSPSVKSHLNAAVGFIGQTFIRSRMVKVKDKKGKESQREKMEYCIRVGPNSLYTTKVRKPKSTELPDILVDPTYEELVSIIQGE